VLQVPAIYVSECLQPLWSIVADLTDSENVPGAQPEQDNVSAASFSIEATEAMIAATGLIIRTGVSGPGYHHVEIDTEIAVGPVGVAGPDLPKAPASQIHRSTSA
jgi:hypothetical protein